MSDLSKRARFSMAAGILSAGALGIGLLLGGGPAAMAVDRPGNNGTIKIEGEPLSEQPNNEPHVDCVFNVEFRGYGEGDFNATVSFALQAPTLTGNLTVIGNTNPFIGADPPGGAPDLDASEQYTLQFSGGPHPIQGYHVKVTIHAPDSLGNDTKYKVFWVKPCEGPTTPPTETPTVTPSGY
ncbi:hypothetical protein [Kribbella sp. CA-294648]|uniref:hypothetical protein n=1 Tax=Kribbella sp. CA-294648 TaxID=3239948 RepID=UPI003D8FBDE9